MFEGEIIFYNGFNLLVDIIVACIAGFIFYRMGNTNGYIDGIERGSDLTLDAIDNGVLTKQVCPDSGELLWTFKPEERPQLFLVPEAD